MSIIEPKNKYCIEFGARDGKRAHVLFLINKYNYSSLLIEGDPGDCGPYMPPEKFTILRTEDTDAPEKGVASISVNSVLNVCKQQLGKHFEN
jgi:hypothetical protein